MLLRFLKSASALYQSPRRRRARARLREGVAAYVCADRPRAMERCERSLESDASYADAWYWRAVLWLMDGDNTRALECLERALQLVPGSEPYLCAKGDALLLDKREQEALDVFARALSEGDASPDQRESTPALRAHPVWLKHLSSVTMPRPRAEYACAQGLPSLRLEHVAASHYSNYAALLANSSRIGKAIEFFERAAAEDPEFPFPHAALALIHTLNRNCSQAVAHALAAKRAGVEVLPDCNDLCLLDAALALGQRPGELDDFLDWTPLWSSDPESALASLPKVDESSFVPPVRSPLTCFIACDVRYFVEHAQALIWSIHDHCAHAGVHVHFFAAPGEAGAAFEALRRQAAPLAMHASYESVDFERYGGRARYCAHARYGRLYQWVMANEGRVALLDADSLVRGDLVAATQGLGDIALVYAVDEPIWHRVLSGFSTYRPSAQSRRFLGRMAGLAALNLTGGRARYSLDQTALYVCATLARADGTPIDTLPLEYCDTTFQDHSLVWSVTQSKQLAGRFQELKSRILQRDGEEGLVLSGQR